MYFRHTVTDPVVHKTHMQIFGQAMYDAAITYV